MRNGKEFTRVSLPTFLVLVAMLVVACGGGSGTSSGTPTAAAKAPASQQVLKFYGFDAPVTDISTFDPGQVQDAPSIDAIQMVFTGLVTLDDHLAVQAQLAQSYDKSTDGLTYTFHLRPNLKFSDGTPLTATDVAYSIDRSLSPPIFNLTGVSLTYMGLIKNATERTAGKVSTVIGTGVVVPDPNTVVIHVTTPTAYFLQALAYPTSFVVEKSVIDKWGMKWTDHLSDNGGQGGAGPFKVKSYNHSTGIVMVPNPNYYGPKPQLQEADYIFYKDINTLYEAYQANQVDMTRIPSSDLASAKTQPGFAQTPVLIIDYFGMNYLAKPFDNVHIRQAFELAMNKDAVLTAVYKGARTPTCHIVPSGMYGFAPNLTCPQSAPTSGDTAKAKQLLQQGMQEEGWTSVSQIPPIKITYQNNTPELDNEITSYRQEWKSVLGIDISTATLDFTPLIAAETASTGNAPPKGLQMWAAAWGADYADPQDWTTLQFGKGQPYNNFNYGQNSGATASEQQQVQQQLVAADSMSNVVDRAHTYNDLEQKLVNDVAWLPNDQRTQPTLTKTYVIGLIRNAQSEVPPNDWANIYIASH
jgi:peptide/nickel transport system substrate-binding protein/oligopeptide transport system substrate-binding protein